LVRALAILAKVFKVLLLANARIVPQINITVRILLLVNMRYYLTVNIGQSKQNQRTGTTTIIKSESDTFPQDTTHTANYKISPQPFTTPQKEI
jgi:hypothetical protein